jgi:hypothetical protein
MGKQSGKRHASAGNPISNVKADGKVEADAELSHGDGDAGEAGIETSGNDIGQSETDYAGLVELVKSHNETVRSDIINRAWHPEAKEGSNIQTNLSDVPVLEGKASYQLSTGEIVEI